MADITNQLQAAAGAASGGEPLYVEDVFSIDTYVGNGGSQTITNGIDLAGKGGLIWFKRRDATGNNTLTDTVNNGRLISESTAALNTNALVSSFNSDGYSLNTSVTPNQSSSYYASWTFRKAPKFFDIVAYAGNSVAGRQISHNLGSAPGCIIVKNITTGATNWPVYHRSLGSSNRVFLNLSSASSNTTVYWQGADPTSTYFTVGDVTEINETGSNYIAYLFAHNAGGFGEDGTDNIISCGSFTTNSSGNATVTGLGFEPSYILHKGTGAQEWWIYDSMRGAAGTSAAYTYTLLANSSSSEVPNNGQASLNPDGFQIYNHYTSLTNIYVAIRRPMKTPTVSTEVFHVGSSNLSLDQKVTTNFPVDLQILNDPATDIYFNSIFTTRLTGCSTRSENRLMPTLVSSSSSSESVGGLGGSLYTSRGWDSTGYRAPSSFYGYTISYFSFKRAPGFFDIVCYTGNGTTGRTVQHGLKAVPEMMLVKRRDSNAGWNIYHVSNGNDKKNYFSTGAAFSSTTWNNTTPTSSVFYLDNNAEVNANNGTYVAYLFTSLDGISKVSSYSGTGTTNQINCGFSGGARFVLIKRVDTAGYGWYVYDSARGIVAGNDSYFFMDTTAANVTGTDYIDPYSSGFELSSTAPAGLNASGGTYIYLAIA